MTVQLATFLMSSHEGADSQSALNRFLRSHTVLQYQAEYRPSDGTWSVLVHYSLSAAKNGASSAGSAKIDYREVLSPADFAVYARLRNLRRQIAEEQGLAVYALFTNAQLAAMAAERPKTAHELRRIDGVGEAKVASFGPAFLAALQDVPLGQVVDPHQ